MIGLHKRKVNFHSGMGAEYVWSLWGHQTETDRQCHSVSKSHIRAAQSGSTLFAYGNTCMIYPILHISGPDK